MSASASEMTDAQAMARLGAVIGSFVIGAICLATAVILLAP